MATTTYRQKGDLIDYTPASNVSAGDIVVVGEIVGQVPSDILANIKGSLRIGGIINAPKLSTDAVANAGVKLYWDAGNTRLTTTASTHKLAGLSAEAAASGVADIDVILLAGLTT